MPRRYERQELAAAWLNFRVTWGFFAGAARGLAAAAVGCALEAAAGMMPRGYWSAAALGALVGLSAGITALNVAVTVVLL